MKVVYALLALALLKAIILYKVYDSLPPLELKRRARQGDKRAARLYKVAAYEASLDALLWLAGTASAVVLLIWSARTNWWLPTLIIVITAWLIVWARFSADGWAGKLMSIFAPYHAAFLSFIDPVLGRLALILPAGRPDSNHTHLYEKKDLLDILTKQNRQLDNRIDNVDLKIAGNALVFGDKKVSAVMTPRREVKMVSSNDTIGPLLMDELHKSGFSRFPVVKESLKVASPQVIGTLYLNNLIGYEGRGKIKDLAKHEVYFINEDSNLRQALRAFLKTHHHLLIVVNSFEEMVGVLSLEDVLEQILGKQILDEFDNYEDLRAVAKAEAAKEAQSRNEVPVAPKDE